MAVVTVKAPTPDEEDEDWELPPHPHVLRKKDVCAAGEKLFYMTADGKKRFVSDLVPLLPKNSPYQRVSAAHSESPPVCVCVGVVLRVSVCVCFSPLIRPVLALVSLREDYQNWTACVYAAGLCSLRL